MDQQDTKEAASVTRGQNVLYIAPHDWASIAYFLGPLLDRVDTAVPDVQLLVITADPETAADVVAAAVRLLDERPIDMIAATSATRASRLMHLHPPHLVAGAPAELLQLIRSSTLKLTHVRAVGMAWLDELVAAGGESELETLLIDVPKDAARTVVAAELTPAVEALAERYARRARRIIAATSGEALGIRIEYLSVSPYTRGPALRRLLDQVDPAAAVIYTRNADSEEDARSVLRALGYRDTDPVRLARTAGGDTALVVLYDLPASREELREACGAHPGRVVAFVEPRQLTSLRALAGDGATLAPLTFGDAVGRAYGRESSLRSELREILDTGTFARELLTLEPLLEDYDGIEIAAALLVLLERARTASPPAPQLPAPHARQSADAKLYVNVGARDHVGPGDLMGAILNETGTAREAIGRIEVKDNFSLVDVPAHLAEQIAEKLTGVDIRGRRVLARIDQQRPGRSNDRPRRDQRPSGDRPRSGRPRDDRPRNGRSDRPRGDRPRGERPQGDRPRGTRTRSDRPPRREPE